MKQLNKLQTVLFLAGGFIMTAGAGCYAFLFMQKAAAVVYLVGAILFASMQIIQSYDGNSITLRRLRRITIIADVCFVVAGMLMVEQQWGLMGRMFSGSAYDEFVSYTYNRWVVVLLVAALLEIYITHRIGQELKKEADTKKD